MLGPCSVIAIFLQTEASFELQYTAVPKKQLENNWNRDPRLNTYIAMVYAGIRAT